MKTYYVFDSSVYYVSKLISNFSSNNAVNFCLVSSDHKIMQEEIIFIVNDLNDFIDYLVIKEKHTQTHLVITCSYLIQRLKLTTLFIAYTYNEFETHLKLNLSNK